MAAEIDHKSEPDYKKLYEQEQKKVSALEQKLRLYELPGDMRAYYSLQRILNQQADYLASFDLSKEIRAFSKEDKVYDRSCDLWEKLAPNITKMISLRDELKITGDEKKDTARKPSFLDKAIS